MAGNPIARGPLRAGGRRPGVGPPLRRRRAAPGPPAQSPGRAGRDPAGPGRPGAESGEQAASATSSSPSSCSSWSTAEPTPVCGRPSTLPALRRPGRRRLRRPRGRRRPRSGLPVPADRRAPAAALRGPAGPHRAEPARSPGPPGPRPRLPRPASATALAQFESDLRHHQTPGFAGSTNGCSSGRCWSRSPPARAADGSARLLSPEAVVDRLQAFGFADAERTSQAVRELTRGFSRSSQLMSQMLPILLDWLSDLTRPRRRPARSADPRHRDPPPGSAHRPVPGVARSGPPAVPADRHRARASSGPSSASRTCSAGLATGDTLADRTRAELDERAAGWLAWRSGEGGIERGLQLFTRAEILRIAARDALGLVDVDATGVALTDLAESVVDAALRIVDPPLPFAVVGMGRLGGRELAYTSDLDLLFVYEAPPGWSAADAAAQAESVASGPGAPARRHHPGHRPVPGGHGAAPRGPPGSPGPQPRGLRGLLRALGPGVGTPGPAAGPDHRRRPRPGRPLRRPGRRVRVGSARSARADFREIRRTKARIERERVPASDDPKFHLKLGPGSLSDIEWTAQLLQLAARGAGHRDRGRPRRNWPGGAPWRPTTTGCSSRPTASASGPATGWPWSGTAPATHCRRPAPT